MRESRICGKTDSRYCDDIVEKGSFIRYAATASVLDLGDTSVSPLFFFQHNNGMSCCSLTASGKTEILFGCCFNVYTVG